MTDTTERVVDYSAFEAEVDRVVEAAANRDAEIQKANDEWSAYMATLVAEEDRLREEMDALAAKRGFAQRVHRERVAKINEAFDPAANDDPPF
jgi:hypothetical protein